MRCFGNTSSHLNNEVKKHWAWMVLGWETTWELLVLLAWVWFLMLPRGERMVPILDPI